SPRSRAPGARRRRRLDPEGPGDEPAFRTGRRPGRAQDGALLAEIPDDPGAGGTVGKAPAADGPRAGLPAVLLSLEHDARRRVAEPGGRTSAAGPEDPGGPGPPDDRRPEGHR